MKRNTKYIVMVDFDSEGSEEYTGTVHTTYEDARKEFLKAKSDCNIICAWIRQVTFLNK